MTQPLDANGVPAPVIPLPAARTAVLKETADSLGDLLASRQLRLRFSVERDDGPDRVVIELVDDRDGAVVRRIPPERLLHIVSGIEELAGLVVDARAR